MKNIILFLLSFISLNSQAQVKVLFDATKAETASNADWIIDADYFNLRYDPNPYVDTGSNNREANPQRFPTPDQSTVTATTTEDYWTGGNSAWGIELVQYGYQVETLPYDAAITYNDASNPQDLSNYDVYIITEPNILFTNSEKTAILEFVQNGGGLFITSDHDISDRNGDGYDSVDVWNDLFQNNDIQTDPFGFLFDYDNFSTTTYSVANLPGNPILHGYFGDVTALEFHGGTSIARYPSDNTTVTGLIFKQGTDVALFVSAKFGSGRVVAIGDSSPADDGTGDIHDSLYNGWYDEGNGSHRKLMLNATIWLAQNVNAINVFDIQEQIKLVANNGFLQLKANGNMKPDKVSVINLQGQVLSKTSYTNQGIDLRFLPVGFYIIRVTFKNSDAAFVSKLVYN